MFRYRGAEKRSKAALAAERCPFCHIEEAGPLVEETALSRVTEAKFTYNLWEYRHVTDHLLVLPKRHVSRLDQLTPEEQADIMKLLAKYEADNYNVYARGVNSAQRTERHQHTHLIRTTPGSARFGLYLKKPYLLIRF